MQGILGVFQKLVAGKAHDHEGFRILESLAQHAPYDAFSQYLPEVPTKVWPDSIYAQLHMVVMSLAS